MASPLASTSRHMLGMRSGVVTAARAAVRTATASQVPRRQTFAFSTTALLRAGNVATTVDLQDAAEAASSEAEGATAAGAGEDVAKLDEAIKTATNPLDLAMAKAAQKAYFDTLELQQQEEAMLAERRRMRLTSARLQAFEEVGSTQNRDTAFRPHHARLNPITARELTVSHLMAATAHVGHVQSATNRAASSFVYGSRNGQAIIDVERFTLPALRLACKVIKDVIYRGGVVVIVGTASGTEGAIIAAAKRMGGYYVTGRRWLPGTLSNAPRLLTRAIFANAETYEQFVKQEGEEAKRAEEKEEEQFGPRRRRPKSNEGEFDAIQLASQRLQPDLMVVLNPKANIYAIKEATAANVPTIGVTDTDVDPRLVTYAIPANDESVRTAELIIGLLSKAGQEGREARRRWDDEQAKRQAEQDRVIEEQREAARARFRRERQERVAEDLDDLKAEEEEKPKGRSAP